MRVSFFSATHDAKKFWSIPMTATLVPICLFSIQTYPLYEKLGTNRFFYNITSTWTQYRIPSIFELKNNLNVDRLVYDCFEFGAKI